MIQSIMVIGTASHVGKSVITTALCRIFRQDGLAVAPFKVQNISRNSAVTPDGREISRAQAAQAEAAGIAPNAHMNPILLKPTDVHTCQVIVQGQAWADQSAASYMQSCKEELWEKAQESFHYLAQRFSVIVMEGAGSPVEMNLKSRDLANMRAAEMADAHVILVADIERGGVFASVMGTLQLLEAHERRRIIGIIINKFQGDPSLFDAGVQFLQDHTGIPVLGVLPYIPHLAIDEEDSLGLDSPRYMAQHTGGLRIAIIPLPHIANFTDIDALFWEKEVDPYFARRPQDLEDADGIIIPGTKNTMEDLLWLHREGWAERLNQRRSQGCPMLGICGGYQMMGQVVRDPKSMESPHPEALGLGWIPMETTLIWPKQTRWVQGFLADPADSLPISGYEIHMGRTTPLSESHPLAKIRSTSESDWRLEGAVLDEMAVVGTYLHGILDNQEFRERWLNRIRQHVGLDAMSSTVSVDDMRERAYDRLATVVRGHIRLDVVYQALQSNTSGDDPLAGTPS